MQRSIAMSKILPRTLLLLLLSIKGCSFPAADPSVGGSDLELIWTPSGQFGGVGIEISVEEGVPQVISAIEGTPAASAGIEPGDRIVKADGQPIVGLDIEAVVSRLRGSPGTKVVLTIARSGKAPFTVDIIRAIVK